MKRWLPAVLWMILILVASTDLGAGSNSYLILKPLLQWFSPNITEQEIYGWNIFFRKMMHVAQFAVLSGLVWKTRRPIWHRPGPGDLRLAAFTLAVAIVFSAASEGIQLLFPKSRGASVTDVFIDLGGAVLGLVIIWFMKRGETGRPPSGDGRPPADRPARRQGVRVLVTADLHLDQAEGEVTVLDHLRSAIIEEAPDVCVIAGDIGTAERADHWLKLLREATGGIPLVACLGNHDHWIDEGLWDEFPTPSAVRDGIWRPAFARAKIHALDYGNFTAGGLVITGGYGHFDLGMRDRNLAVSGELATLDHYRSGRFAGVVWNDMRHIPHAAETIESEARLQAEGIGRRLD
ncbi:MAG TPA: VanZ family protein, partial [Terrimicrobiaceae bacterium]|nr:VanZ family protein [Terrimicrobiaceae bacterium]